MAYYAAQLLKDGCWAPLIIISEGRNDLTSDWDLNQKPLQKFVLMNGFNLHVCMLKMSPRTLKKTICM